MTPDTATPSYCIADATSAMYALQSAAFDAHLKLELEVDRMRHIPPDEPDAAAEYVASVAKRDGFTRAWEFYKQTCARHVEPGVLTCLLRFDDDMTTQFLDLAVVHDPASRPEVEFSSGVLQLSSLYAAAFADELAYAQRLRDNPDY